MQRPSPIVRSRSEHPVSRRDIDPDALKVLYRLHQSGYQAYLVGGSVRDLMIGRKPKDFDIGTSAHPNEIRRLFRNCFLIGRRFRLAHIRYGTKVIETSTFRRDALPEELPPADAADQGHPHHENTFGTAEEDAHRRDFTINGLFYDIGTFSVIDYVGGLADLESRLVRSIGDPDVRFGEDPVRMLRAVRVASRLGFAIEPATREAIVRNHALILKAPPSRLLDEVYRLYGFGAGEAAFRLLRELGLLRVLFPEIDAYLGRGGEEDGQRLWRCMAAHDRGGFLCGDSTPTLAFCALFCAPFRAEVLTRREGGEKLSYMDLAEAMLRPWAQRLHLPRAVYFHMLRLFGAQQRLDGWAGGRDRDRRLRFVSQDFFADALALAEIDRAGGGWDGPSLDEWRRSYDEAVVAQGQSTAPDERPAPARRRRRRRRHGAPVDDGVRPAPAAAARVPSLLTRVIGRVLGRGRA